MFADIQDQWRSVTIDDRIPVDLFGRTLLVGIRPLQLWPLILSKAILKVRVYIAAIAFHVTYVTSALTGTTCVMLTWEHIGCPVSAAMHSCPILITKFCRRMPASSMSTAFLIHRFNLHLSSRSDFSNSVCLALAGVH